MRYTETQQQLQSMARQFSDTHIRPIAEELDREEKFPHELYLQMGELGLASVFRGLWSPILIPFPMAMEELSEGILQLPTNAA